MLKKKQSISAGRKIKSFRFNLKMSFPGRRPAMNFVSFKAKQLFRSSLELGNPIFSATQSCCFQQQLQHDEQQQSNTFLPLSNRPSPLQHFPLSGASARPSRQASKPASEAHAPTSPSFPRPLHRGLLPQYIRA